METTSFDFLSPFLYQKETTEVLAENINDINQITDSCESLILIRPIFPQNTQKEVNFQSIRTLAILGDGDYRLDGEYFVQFLEESHQKGAIIESLIMMNLEISPEDLGKTLNFMKKDLKALKISQVPLENAHFEKLNENSLKLEYLSLSYSQADEKDTFNESNQQNSERSNSQLELDFKNFDSGLKYLEIMGFSVSKSTFEAIKSKFADSLEHLILEKLNQPNEEIFKQILINTKTLKKLETLSLNGNCLRNINFLALDEENIDASSSLKNSNLFPATLRTLNLNSTEVNEKQITEIITLLTRSGCHLQSLHLENCDLVNIKEIFGSSKGLNKCKIITSQILLQTKDNILEATEPESLLSNTFSCTQNLFPQLLKNYKDIISITSSDQDKAFGNLTNLFKNKDISYFFPVVLKMLRELKFFQNAQKSGLIDFTKDLKTLLPKNDFQQALEPSGQNADVTIDLQDLYSVGLFDGFFVNRIHSSLLEKAGKEKWETLSMQTQRENLKILLDRLGFRCKERKKSDCIINDFLALVEDSEYIAWDYRLATFSLEWYDGLGLVVVKFNLSDDWFLKGSERTSKYTLKNMDFLINTLSEWNIKPLDFVFELEVLNDGETEVKFKHQIMVYGKVNLAKSILIALDKGFIILKALQKENLFDRDDFSQTNKDAKQIRKEFKSQLKQYSNSPAVLNLLKH